MLALLLACASPPPAVVPEGVPRHAIVLVIDTLRVDAPVNASTPNLDEFARAGQEVRRAWSPSTWTAPSVVSLFTGAHVRQHGWDLPFPSRMDGHAYPHLPDLPVLAGVLHDAGFETTGLYGNPLLQRDLGYDRGFDRWSFIADHDLVAAVAEEVSGWDGGQRHFLYLHMFGAHQPLRPSGDARRRWGLEDRWFPRREGFRADVARAGGPEAKRAYRRAYYARIEDLDRELGELLTVLSPVRPDAAMILTADHGEMLGEHGMIGHQARVWEPLVHVPFCAQGVGPIPAQLSTAALPDLVTRTLKVPHDWPVTVESALPLASQREGRLTLSADGVHKAIWDPELAVYDLRADPGEEHPLVGSDDSYTALRGDFFERVPGSSLAPEDAPMSASMTEALTALGYVE